MELKRIKADDVWTLSERNSKNGRIYLLAKKESEKVLNEVYTYMKDTAEKGENEFHFSKIYRDVTVNLKKLKEIVESILKEDGYTYSLNILNDTSFDLKVDANL